MRIAFLLDSFAIGGTELNAIKVAEALTRASVPLTIFHFQTVGPLRSRYEALGLEMIHVPIDGLFTRSAKRAVARIQQECRQRNIDLLHTHCVYSNILAIAFKLPGLSGLPVLASRRWTGYASRSGLNQLNRVAQSVANAVLVNAPGLVNVVRRESPFSRPVYVPNMLPDSNFRRITNIERAQKRLQYGIPDVGSVTGVVARLVPVKGHDTLINAWRTVVQRVPDAHLAIIGDGPLRDALSHQVEELGLSGNIHFAGNVSPEDLPHSMLDVSVLSSLDEGFPNSLLESMAQGVPVVSTNVGGVPDLVSHGTNGLLIPRNDARAMAEAILAILEHTVDVEAIRGGADQTAEQHREDAVVSALLRLYRSTTGGESSSRD